MKNLSISLVIMLMISATAWAARTGDDIQKDLNKAAKTSVEIYNKSGMAGLIGETEKCYVNSKINKFYCVYFDLASRHIDQIMVEAAAKQGMTFPKTEFFDDELFGSRIGPVFANANMDMDKSNKYLQKMTPLVNKMVENYIYRKKK